MRGIVLSHCWIGKVLSECFNRHIYYTCIISISTQCNTLWGVDIVAEYEYGTLLHQFVDLVQKLIYSYTTSYVLIHNVNRVCVVCSNCGSIHNNVGMKKNKTIICVICVIYLPLSLPICTATASVSWTVSTSLCLVTDYN